MNNRRLWLLLVFTALLVGGTYLFRAATANGMALPLVDSVLGPPEPTVPDIMPPDQQIVFWTNRLSPNTKDYITLTHLGHAYLMQARVTGDADSYARAEEALQRALSLNERYAPAKNLLGSVYIGNHAFAKALAGAQEALQADPTNLQALAVSGDSALELGQYAEAESAFRTLLDAAPGGPAYSRMSRLTWLLGRPDEAIDWMRRAADETLAMDIGGEELAWYRFQLGELYFNTGDLRAAHKWYDESGQALPDYYLAQSGLGKVAAARGHRQEAIDIYETLVARMPLPGFVAYLGDLYTLEGDTAAAQNQYDTVGFIRELEERQQVLYNRQMAVFYANHNTEIDLALTYAEKELKARQDIYAYDTLAWALYRHGRYDEARAASDKALALGTHDALLHYHAGMIAAALGDKTRAASQLDLALQFNPNFDLIQANAARETLAGLSN